ncbi:hypothetical protein NLO95_14755 [Pseudomonas syringae]|nr:hypothetical protein [Pseudomonas syringae]
MAIDKSVAEADIIFDRSCRLVDEAEALGGLLKSAYHGELPDLGCEELRVFHEAAYSSLTALIWEHEKLFIDVLGKCGVHLDQARMELTVLVGKSLVWRAKQVEIIQMVQDIDVACQKLHLASVQYSRFYGFFKNT